MASARRTYDTDNITLRTVFAKNPDNTNVPALRALTADGAGGAYWAIPSSLGGIPAFNEIITSAASYTADLSYNKFRLLAGQNIGMTNGPAGSNQTTLYGKSFSQFDVSGENTLTAFTGGVVTAAVKFAGEGGIQITADPATNTLFINGPTSVANISTGIYGFNQIKVTSVSSTITSSIQNFGGDYITATSPSTLLNLLGYNDIQLSTNVTTNSVFFTISTFTSQGYLAMSNTAYGAYPSSISTVSALYTPLSSFQSTSAYFQSVNQFNLSSIYSTIDGLAMSTGQEFYLLTGLINACATLIQLNNNIAAVNLNIRSTSIGLGSLGYISSCDTCGGGGGGGDGVTDLQLKSTFNQSGVFSSVGLGYNAGYVSQGDYGVSLGYLAGNSYQGANAVAIGYYAGNNTQTGDAVAIGTGAGSNLQGDSAVAIGHFAGHDTQNGYGIAIGNSAGFSNQNSNAIAIGINAGTSNQGSNTIALGTLAALSNQGEYGIALGTFAGGYGQGISAVAMGQYAGYDGQSTNAIAIGTNAGSNTQDSNAIAIGYLAGATSQFNDSVAIGTNAGYSNQSAYSVALGIYSGAFTQASFATALGPGAAQENQGSYAISLGFLTGSSNQGIGAIAIGAFTAASNQGSSAIAIGNGAGFDTQLDYSIAIGEYAGTSNQDSNCIAIGYQAGYSNQNTGSIALGLYAGFSNQGSNSIAIGTTAGYSNQMSNSIILNALGTNLDATNSGFYVAPLRDITTSQPLSLAYNTLEYEIGTTEVGLVSSLNTSSIKEPISSLTVNVNALWSTLYKLYPACFA